jgi:hypothetical protein
LASFSGSSSGTRFGEVSPGTPFGGVSSETPFGGVSVFVGFVLRSVRRGLSLIPSLLRSGDLVNFLGNDNPPSGGRGLIGGKLSRDESLEATGGKGEVREDGKGDSG